MLSQLTSPRRRGAGRLLRRYLLATSATAAALVLTLALPDALHRPFFLFFIASAGLSAWYGGWGAGLLATGLGALASAYFQLSAGRTLAVSGSDSLLRLALFVASALFLVWVLARLRKAQDALRDSEERYRTTLNSIGDAVIATDSRGRVLFANPVARELTGCGPQPCEGLMVNDIFRIAADDHHPVEHPIQRVLRTGAVDTLPQGLLLEVSGKQIPVDESAAPIRDDEGNLIGAVLVFRDMRARQRAEEALRASEKLAATGRLAASIAHEINNPMESVTNLLYLLEHHPSLDQAARQYAQLAEQELSRMENIVKQTLGFYREAAMPVPVRPSAVLDNILQLYRRKIDAAGIHVHKRYRFTGEIRAFPGEMRQVLSNLFANALEAVGRDGVISLHVVCTRDWLNPERQGVRVTVGDSGPGIPAEDRRHIFEPFFTTKGEKGTGLGLWVTNGMVRKHGGRIRVRSSTGPDRRGTCFSIFLPGEPIGYQRQIIPGHRAA